MFSKISMVYNYNIVIVVIILIIIIVAIIIIIINIKIVCWIITWKLLDKVIRTRMAIAMRTTGEALQLQVGNIGDGHDSGSMYNCQKYGESQLFL